MFKQLLFRCKLKTGKCSISQSSVKSLMFIKPICKEDIIWEINLLDYSKCYDMYDIPIKIVKLSKYTIAPTLSYLFNPCINEEIFPNALKITKVLPIHKKGEKDNFQL